MKRNVILAAAALCLILAGGIALAQQQGYGQGYGQQNQGWFCPWCAQGQTQEYGMGPGMMYRGQGQAPGWYGQSMGPGHMQGWQGHMGPGHMQGWQGRGMGPGMKSQQWGRGQYGPGSTQPQIEPLSRTAAQELAKNYVAGNPNLKVGEVREQDEAYVAHILTQDDSLVEKLVIDKRSGWMRKEY